VANVNLDSSHIPNSVCAKDEEAMGKAALASEIKLADEF